jgi:hypothetical protein
MLKKVGGMSRRSVCTALAAVTLTSALAFAAGLPIINWNVLDGGKAVRQRPAKVTQVIITNLGADAVIVSSKGASVTKGGTILPGYRGSMGLPHRAKNVKITDANPGNGKGSNGVIVWASAGLGMSATGTNGDLLTAPFNPN